MTIRPRSGTSCRRGANPSRTCPRTAATSSWASSTSRQTRTAAPRSTTRPPRPHTTTIMAAVAEAAPPERSTCASLAPNRSRPPRPTRRARAEARCTCSSRRRSTCNRSRRTARVMRFVRATFCRIRIAARSRKRRS